MMDAHRCNKKKPDPKEYTQCNHLFPTLCDPMDCTVPGILQARILEWVAYPTRGSSQPRSPALQADSLPTELSGKPLIRCLRTGKINVQEKRSK